jgi:hypothetical protein
MNLSMDKSFDEVGALIIQSLLNTAVGAFWRNTSYPNHNQKKYL